MTTATILLNARWTHFVWCWERLGKAICLPYSITLWSSHPDEGNDDCSTGEDYATNAEACAEYMQIAMGGSGAKLLTTSEAHVYFSNWAYVMLDGPDVHLVAKNPAYSAKRARREAREADAEWRNERANQAGMAFGCNGYNDELGY